jgi:hypothetical protein
MFWITLEPATPNPQGSGTQVSLHYIEIGVFSDEIPVCGVQETQVSTYCALWFPIIFHVGEKLDQTKFLRGDGSSLPGRERGGLKLRRDCGGHCGGGFGAPGVGRLGERLDTGGRRKENKLVHNY